MFFLIVRRILVKHLNIYFNQAKDIVNHIPSDYSEECLYSQLWQVNLRMWYIYELRTLVLLIRCVIVTTTTRTHVSSTTDSVFNCAF